MTEYKALELPVDRDLRKFSVYLWQQGIAHRISEHRGRQVVWVENPELREPVNELYANFDDSRYELVVEEAPRREPGRRPLEALKSIPVTATLLILSLLGASLVWIDFDWVNLFTFYEITRVGDDYRFDFPPGQYWRLVTPIFIHFGVLHIVFNALWTWELGRRIETMQGGFQLLGITLLIGVGSNIAQGMITTGGVFGGMSGVIYGYLGYMVVWSALRPERSFGLPGAIVAFMLGWLLLCLAGFARVLGLGEIANAAHVGGLLMGAVLGGVAGLVGRDEPRRSG